MPLVVLYLIEGLAFSGVKLPLFYDLAAHTRFLIAVLVLVLADIPVGARLRQVVRHFFAAGLIREDDLAKFGEIALDTVRFRDSRVVCEQPGNVKWGLADTVRAANSPGVP